MEFFTVPSLLLVFHLWILIVILAFEVCILNFIEDLLKTTHSDSAPS